MSERPQYRIKVSNTFSRFPLLRQTPQQGGRWKDCQFYVHEPVEECDAWFIFDGLEQTEETRCPVNRVFFFASEPPAFKTYNQSWMRRFPRVLTYNPYLKHPGRQPAPLGIHWFVEKTYDELCASAPPEKSKMLSVICSRKTTTRGHRLRLEFVERLSRLVSMDVFGRGFTPIKDKWDGLAAYRYSIAIENCTYPDYWSEKIADCYLTGTVPLYYGCPNIDDYFSPQSLIPITIDLKRVHETAEKIRLLTSPEDYQSRLPDVLAARERVLQEYNMFDMLRRFTDRTVPEGERRLMRFSPEPPMNFFQRKWCQWMRMFSEK